MENTASGTTASPAKIYEYAVKMKSAGKSDLEIYHGLKEIGLTHEEAEKIGADIENEYNKVQKKAANKNMLYGGLLFVVGCITTYASYQTSQYTGTGVIWYGAIILGAARFIKGMMQMPKS